MEKQTQSEPSEEAERLIDEIIGAVETKNGWPRMSTEFRADYANRINALIARRVAAAEAEARELRDAMPERPHLRTLIDWLDKEQLAGRWGGAHGSREIQIEFEQLIEALAKFDASRPQPETKEPTP